jgi:hypothetical protein
MDGSKRLVSTHHGSVMINRTEIGMPRTRTEPWASYAAWLKAERDVSAQTANNYVSLVRRTFANLDTLSSDSLADYVDSHPVAHRSPMRSAWRRFVEWSEQRVPPVTIPTFPKVEADTLPMAVQGAIRMLREDGVTGANMRLLTWDVDKDPALTTLMPDRTWIRAPEDHKIDAFPLSPSALHVLQEWGYPDREPGREDPLVPRGPGVARPMPLATIRRVLRDS